MLNLFKQQTQSQQFLLLFTACLASVASADYIPPNFRYSCGIQQKYPLFRLFSPKNDELPELTFHVNTAFVSDPVNVLVFREDDRQFTNIDAKRELQFINTDGFQYASSFFLCDKNYNEELCDADEWNKFNIYFHDDLTARDRVVNDVIYPNDETKSTTFPLSDYSSYCVFYGVNATQEANAMRDGGYALRLELGSVDTDAFTIESYRKQADEAYADHWLVYARLCGLTLCFFFQACLTGLIWAMKLKSKSKLMIPNSKLFNPFSYLFIILVYSMIWDFVTICAHLVYIAEVELNHTVSKEFQWLFSFTNLNNPIFREIRSIGVLLPLIYNFMALTKPSFKLPIAKMLTGSLFFRSNVRSTGFWLAKLYIIFNLILLLPDSLLYSIFIGPMKSSLPTTLFQLIKQIDPMFYKRSVRINFMLAYHCFIYLTIPYYWMSIYQRSHITERSELVNNFPNYSKRFKLTRIFITLGFIAFEIIGLPLTHFIRNSMVNSLEKLFDNGLYGRQYVDTFINSLSLNLWKFNFSLLTVFLNTSISSLSVILFVSIASMIWWSYDEKDDYAISSRDVSIDPKSEINYNTIYNIAKYN